MTLSPVFGDFFFLVSVLVLVWVVGLISAEAVKLNAKSIMAIRQRINNPFLFFMFFSSLSSCNTIPIKIVPELPLNYVIVYLIFLIKTIKFVKNTEIL